MDYYICGIGFVTPESCGCGRDFHAFDPNPWGKLKPVSRKDVIDKPYKPFGRMDLFSKTGFSGIYFACKDADIKSQPLINDKNTKLNAAGRISNTDNTDNTDNTGNTTNKACITSTGSTSIIASSIYGCLDTDKNFFDTIKLENGKNASPALFAYTLPNTFLGEASIYFGFTGQNFIINESTPTGLTGLTMGIDILDNGESDFVICGLCDTGFPEMPEICDDYFPGSLFFTISKIKQKFGYGKIKINTAGSIKFNGTSIKSLRTLAQICINDHGRTK